MARRRCGVAFVLVLCVAATACQSSNPAWQDECDEMITNLTRCYPDLEVEGECTPDTLSAYEQYNLDTQECDNVDNLGKADVFAFGGCPAGEHVCGFVFCCDDYVVTAWPGDDDFDIVGLIDAYQAEVPPTVEEDFTYATRQDLLDGMARTWEQDVMEVAGGEAQPMAVHISKLLIEVAYGDFVQRLPPASWGVELAFYLGGERWIYEEDASGLILRQVERMVLSPFKINMDLRLGNMDMTKVEVIHYDVGRTKVYWRVYYSDNDSTEADVGSVEFIAYDDTSTLVVFHSAHRLNAPGGIHLPNDLVQHSLQTFFLDHARHYRDLVE